MHIVGIEGNTTIIPSTTQHTWVQHNDYFVNITFLLPSVWHLVEGLLNKYSKTTPNVVKLILTLDHISDSVSNG